MAKKAVMKKKAVSAKQANSVAAFMKSQKTGGTPKLPTPKSAPVKTYDDDADDSEE